MKKVPNSLPLRLFRWSLVLLFLRVLFGIVSNYDNYFPANFKLGFLAPHQYHFRGLYATAFYAHILVGPVTLLAGLLLLPRVYRQQWPTAHRWLGRCQVALVLFCLAPSGLAMAIFAPTTSIRMAFGVLSLLTGTTVALGWLAAYRRNFHAHRRWMLRCFALLCSAILLRVLGGLAELSGAHGIWTYESAAWLSWILPLLTTELLLRRETAFGGTEAASQYDSLFGAGDT